MNEDNTLLIMLTASVTVAITEYNLIAAKKNPTMKPVLAGFAMGIFLFGMNALNSELAKSLCLLILIASILLNGKSLITKLGAL